MSTSRVSTEELASRARNGQSQVVDIRSIDAYNGWPVGGAPRGGHVPGARSLPAKWLKYLDWPDIVTAKSLDKARGVILYGDSEDQLDRTVERFVRAGLPKPQIYPDFSARWCAEPDLPLESLPRYRQLVGADWLKQLLTTGSAPEYDNDRFVLCHGHYRNPGDYVEGHIPGAIQVDSNWLESPETWNRRSPDELGQTLERLGITSDTTAVFYGRFSFPDYDDPYPGSSAGHLGSIRCAMIMLYAGVRDVRILNGGLQSWLDAGYETTTEAAVPEPIDSFGAEIPARPDVFVDTPEAKQFLADPEANLVSVRSWREYIGQVSGYHYIQKKGRIPGAVFGNCGSDAYHMENYRNVDHTTREYPEIRRLWAEAGITPDKRNAFYCGTGWRASEAFLNAWLMDWPDIAIYDGGWFEWSSDGTNPTEGGEPATPQPLASDAGR